MVQVDPNNHPDVIRVPETLIETPLLLLATSKCMKGFAIVQLVFGIITLGLGIGASAGLPWVWINLTGVIVGGIWTIAGIIGTLSTRGICFGKCPINFFYGLFSFFSVGLAVLGFILSIVAILMYLIIGGITCQITKHIDGSETKDCGEWIAVGLFVPILIISLIELLIGSIAFLQCLGLKCCCCIPPLRPNTMWVSRTQVMELDKY